MTAGNTEISLSVRGNIPCESVSARYEKFSEIDAASAKYVLEDGIGNQIHTPREFEGVRIYIATFPQHENEDSSAFFEIRDGKDNAIKKYTSYSLPMQFISASSHRLNEISLISWTNAVTSDMKDEIIQLLQLFDPDIEDVDILTLSAGQTFISLKHRKLSHAPLSTFGDGLRRVFTLSTSILSAKNGLLLVDELETAIHTNALEKTFAWLVKSSIQNNVQLFATTHSLETVDAVLGASGNLDLATYRLEMGGEQTQAKRFNKKLLTRMRDNLGLEVR